MFIRNVRYCHFLVLSHCSNIGIRRKPTARIKLCDCLTEPAPAPSSWAWGPPAPAPATPSRRTWGRCSGWISTGAEMRVWAPMILSNYKCKSRVFLLPVALNSEPAGTGNCGLTGPFPSWLVAATYHGDGGVHEAMLRWETACGEMKCASVWDDDPYSQSLYVSRKAVCQVEEYCLGHQLLWGLQHLLSPQPFSRQAL